MINVKNASFFIEGYSTSESVIVPCENHKKALIGKIIGDVDIDSYDDDINDLEESVLEDSFNETIRCTIISSWLNDIMEEAAKTVSE